MAGGKSRSTTSSTILLAIQQSTLRVGSEDFDATEEDLYYLDAAAMEFLVAINLKRRGDVVRIRKVRSWPGKRKTNLT